MPEELYFIQDSRHVVGNCAVWWREEGHGYTCNLNEAWKVPLDIASKYREYRKTDIPRKVSEVYKLMESHVHIDKLRRGQNA